MLLSAQSQEDHRFGDFVGLTRPSPRNLGGLRFDESLELFPSFLLSGLA
jgi:hypothetical protein